MYLILNNLGFFNLVKPEMHFEYNVNSFKTYVNNDQLTSFLKENDVLLNSKHQIIDNQNNIYGILTFLN
jgi:hypothetical protein